MFERWSRLNLDLHLNWPLCQFTCLYTLPCFPTLRVRPFCCRFYPFRLGCHRKPSITFDSLPISLSLINYSFIRRSLLTSRRAGKNKSRSYTFNYILTRTDHKRRVVSSERGREVQETQFQQGNEPCESFAN